MKKLISIILLLTLLLGSAGCSGKNKEAEPTELWVLTEETTGDGMNYVAGVLAEQFAAENPGSSIRLDLIPTDAAEREAFLTNLRVKIAAGDGPDAYLLPAVADLTTETPRKYSYYSVDSLFPDVNIAMGNRQFADLSTYYDADEELDKDALLGIVMDAGVRDGKRYVLPLLFNMMTYCIIPTMLEETSLDEGCFRQDLGRCFQAVINAQDAVAFARVFDGSTTGFFADFIDYETGELCMDRETLLSCVRWLRSLPKETADTMVYSYRNYSYLTYGGETMTAPVRAQVLCQYLDMAAIGHAEGLEMEFLPLRSLNGQVTATVEYYAAVSSSCHAPELAYKYLRMFLSEDAQWDRLRRQPAATQRPVLTESSWPVRAVGSTEALWENYREQNEPMNKEEAARARKLRSAEPDGAVVDSLVGQIEVACFNTDAARALGRLLRSENPEESIDGWLTELEYSLTEG